ncbi:MAG: hypothetical protein FWC40_00815 [Proteobacteria bacterium]|nr:hypothetical protein [Pseudomonadota bacterium]
MEKLTTTDQALEKKSVDVAGTDGSEGSAEEYEEAEKSLDTKVSEALIANDMPKAKNLIKGAFWTSGLKAIATNTTMMNDLLAKPSSDELNVCLDRLYEHVTDVGVLKKCIKARFGVDLVGTAEVDASTNTVNGTITNATEVNQFISNKTVVEWGPNGVKGVYRSLLLLPPSHWPQINGITTTNTTTGTGGSANKNSGCLKVDYQEAAPKKLVSSTSYCDKGDAQHKLSLLDTTVVHEIGHVIDKGDRYSGDPVFRAISGWENKGMADNANAPALRTAIEGCAQVAYPTLLTGERGIVEKGAELLIENKSADPGDIQTQLDQAYSDLTKDPAGQTGSFRSSGDLATELTNNCTVYNHILRSWANKSPWMRGKRSDMNRQIHQGYNNDVWYSFNNAAYDKKISKYQLRDPGEEFAELYATYHVAKPKGKGLKQDHINWIIANDLHKDP